MTVFRPSDAVEVQQVVAWAAAASQPLEIVGGGSKRRLGRPERPEHALELGALRGIVDYDPAELVLTARAATPLSEVERQLAAHRQMLAFEPPDWRGLLESGLLGSGLLGSDAEPTAEPSLGGVIACNLSGPRRVRAGAARDHLLGFSAVNGWGEAWKAGGRVVKNVTGYDMCKLQAGAFGTLSVLTELSLRVLPRPETSCSVLLAGLDDHAGLEALVRALNSEHEVSSAAHLPATVAARSAVAEVAGAGAAVTVLRLEGPRPSIEYRAAALERGLGQARRLPAAASDALWAEIGAARTLLGQADGILWRVCPTPSAAARLLHRLREALPGTEAFYDWGGGLLWLGLDADAGGADGGAARIRAALRETGGHATLVRAPDAIRRAVAVFEPAMDALDALARRVKGSFDPKGVLNPGRIQRGV